MRWAVGLGAALCFALGCGTDENDRAEGTGGATGTGGGSQGSGGSAATGGAGGSAATAGGGSAGTAPLGCSGAWRAPQDVLRAAPNFPLASPTLSPDELELFYVEGDPVSGGNYNFRRSVRSSKTAVFPAGDVAPELNAACMYAGDQRSIDLSRDGLNAYITCYLDPAIASPLRIARRSQVGGKFVLDAQSYGMVGPSVAVGLDELVIFSSDKNLLDPGPPRRYTRSSTSVPFGAPTSIPGLESAGLITPELSPDGLSLFGAASGSLIAAERRTPDGAFAAPTTIIPGDQVSIVLGAPEMSQNCRSLYYVHNEADAGGTLASAIRILTR